MYAPNTLWSPAGLSVSGLIWSGEVPSHHPVHLILQLCRLHQACCVLKPQAVPSGQIRQVFSHQSGGRTRKGTEDENSGASGITGKIQATFFTLQTVTQGGSFSPTAWPSCPISFLVPCSWLSWQSIPIIANKVKTPWLRVHIAHVPNDLGFSCSHSQWHCVFPFTWKVTDTSSVLPHPCWVRPWTHCDGGEGPIVC